jgi:predicted nucleic acid-binding protein
MSTIYVETSIISHVTAWPSKDPQIATLQQQARDWWTLERHKFQLLTSELVIEEVSDGDPVAAAERLTLLDGLSIISITVEARELAAALLAEALMPPKAAADALHVALAAVAGIEYLLTQNCKHIANAHILPRVYELLRKRGHQRLLICTPAEFLGSLANDD